MNKPKNLYSRLAPAFLVALLALTGCATQPPTDPAPDETRVRGRAPNAQVVPVHFATDRQPASPGNAAPWFLGKRGDGRLHYGMVDVSIPKSHKEGELESPAWWRMEFSADPEKHVIVTAVRPQDAGAFWQEIKARLSTAETRKTVLFIHGYNVSFVDAARRTAQFTYDLRFTGTPIFYSWPSRAELLGYADDEKTVEWSMPHLKDFFSDVARNIAGQDEIIVIAHSMGNRPTSRALAQLFTEQPAVRSRFREIILMAPDIDAQVFRNELAPKLISASNRVTLYASSNDLALKASSSLHGGQRLGETKPDIVTLPGMESIDASTVPTDLLGHSYYGDSMTVLTDLRKLVEGVTKAASRGAHLIESVTAQGRRYWKFPSMEATAEAGQPR